MGSPLKQVDTAHNICPYRTPTPTVLISRRCFDCRHKRLKEAAIVGFTTFPYYPLYDVSPLVGLGSFSHLSETTLSIISILTAAALLKLHTLSGPRYLSPFFPRLPIHLSQPHPFPNLSPHTPPNTRLFLRNLQTSIQRSRTVEVSSHEDRVPTGKQVSDGFPFILSSDHVIVAIVFVSV